jgi:3-dehydroquinate dehydratase/shikimate dehydrogenase
MPSLAVAIAAPDTDAALAAMQQAGGRADLAELRLDLMRTFDLPALLAGRPLPVIVTCRPQREGGRWQGSEAERLAVLRQAAWLGADYVDLEWDAAGEIASLDRSRTRVILSRHDFAAMPADLKAQASSLWQAGADAVKLVGMAPGLAGCVPVLRLLADATRPTIAIAMGQHGLLSRVLAFRYPHALLSFAAPDPAPGWAAAAGTAPGQITLSAMRAIYRVQAIDQRTAFIGLLARDADTLPALAEGNAWLERAGHNAVLVPLSLVPGEDAEAALAAIQPTAGLLGCIIPTPTTPVILSPTPVILSGSAQQPALARYSSEESPLLASPNSLWHTRTEARDIIHALRLLLDSKHGASLNG